MGHNLVLVFEHWSWAGFSYGPPYSFKEIIPVGLLFLFYINVRLNW